MAALLLAAAASAGAEVRMVGTDLLGLDTSRALYEFSGRAGFPLALALDGSRPGLDQLKAGRAQIALVVLAPGEQGTHAGFESLPLAYHCVVVLVPSVVPLERITLGQLRDVFGESGARNPGRWGDVGLRGEIAISSIAPHAPAAGQGITTEFFRRAVLEDRPFKSTIARYETLSELAASLAGDRRTLAIAPARPPNAPGVKVVRVAASDGEPAFSPTPENLHSGDYLLGLPLRIVFRRESAQSLRPLLRYLLSDNFAPVLEKANVVPLAPAARQQQLAALEKG